jgi:hypothetical protein
MYLQVELASIPDGTRLGHLSGSPDLTAQLGCYASSVRKTESQTESSEPQDQPVTDEDRLDDLLSEMWHADSQLNNPRTREFLEAGQELLHSGLASDLGDEPDSRSGRFRAPFDELLAWVSRRRVVERAIVRQGDEHGGSVLSESAYRYRWRTQTNYLRDLVVYALRPRMARPEETKKAADVLFEGGPLDQTVDRIAYGEVRNLNEDKAFRLQMVFQAILAHDEYVAKALRRVDQTNVTAWRDFYQQALGYLGLKLRPDVTLDDFAYALQAAGEGVVFRSLLPADDNYPQSALAIDHEERTSRSLALIAMAMLVAFTDSGDGKGLRQVVRELPRASQPVSLSGTRDRLSKA